MDKHKQINESILLGYFTGTLSIPLQQEVEDWISASEENKKIAGTYNLYAWQLRH